MTHLIKPGNNPLYALDCAVKGLLWLGKAELRRFLLIPMLINFILYSIAFTLGYFYFNQWVEHFIPNWLHWLSWLLWPLYFICFVIIVFFTCTMLVNLIASPFYDKLAHKTLALLKNAPEIAKPIEQPWTKVMLAELKRMGYLLKWMLVLMIISIIPVINLFAPLFWAIFGAWGCALEFFAYPLENNGLLFQQQKQWLSHLRFGTLSLGGFITIGLSIPFFNLLVSPAAVIAATIYMYGINSAESV